MATDQLMVAGGPRYVQMKSSPPPSPPAPGEISPAPSFRQGGAEPPNRIFDELPKATIVSVSRPDAGDISPMQLSYTIQVQYKQVRRILVQFWCLIASTEFNCVYKKRWWLMSIIGIEFESYVWI